MTSLIQTVPANYYHQNNWISNSRFKKENTYISIFNFKRNSSNYFDPISEDNSYQIKAYEKLIETKGIKIIFDSELAVNRNPGHGTFPRNKIVVWEFAD